MKIIVQGKTIETKEIVDIVAPGYRMHGFIIQLIDDREVHISEKEMLNMTLSEYADINNKYKSLRKKVEAKWQEDKIDIPVFRL